METKIENAKITATRLGEEHGCLTAYLTLEGRNWCCAYGGYCLDSWYADVGKYSSIDGYGAIIELMKTLEVESWEELKDKYVKVEFDFQYDKILRIGHLMKDNWFSFKEYFNNVDEIQ